jgi:hypothetical protein
MYKSDHHDPRPNVQMEDRPTVNEENTRAKTITIESLNYGFAVNVGCQSFAIENVDTLVNMIGKYLKDPKTVEKQWFNKQLEIK